MGNTEKLSVLFVAALVSVAAILASLYNGTVPDWGPIGELLTEFVSGTGAAAAAFVVVQRVKAWRPDFSGTPLFVFHLVLACVLGPLSYVGLVALNLTEVTERGALVVAGVTFATGKAVYQLYKEHSPVEKERQLKLTASEPGVTVLKEGEEVTPVEVRP